MKTPRENNFGFHAVHIWFHGKHVGYEIYLNNKPFIRLSDGLRLRRVEAYQLAQQMNGF